MRAGAARQGVVAVLEDGLWHLAAPLDWAVQTLVPEIRMRVRVDIRGTRAAYNQQDEVLKSPNV